ncbi:hypothetical protein TELCIR_19327, partial [Teladorsagia circumcincta]
KECPPVMRTLKSLDVGLDLIIGKWFLCWFVEVLPLELESDRRSHHIMVRSDIRASKCTDIL